MQYGSVTWLLKRGLSSLLVAGRKFQSLTSLAFSLGSQSVLMPGQLAFPVGVILEKAKTFTSWFQMSQVAVISTALYLLEASH